MAAPRCCRMRRYRCNARKFLAALSAGTEIIKLRRNARPLDVGSQLGEALEAVARGDSATATSCFAHVDAELSVSESAEVLHARGSALAMSEAFTQHAAYFDDGPPR